MKKRVLVNEEATIYRKIEDVINAYANIFCYGFTKASDIKKLEELYNINQENNKYYMFNDDEGINFRGIVFGSKSDLIAAENLSLVSNILRELGLDPLIKINVSKDAVLLTYLDYLLLDYELTEIKDDNYDNYSFTIVDNETVIASGGNIKSQNIFDLDILKLIDTLRDDFEKISDLDVFIVASSEETELKANMLLQDLRLNNVKTAICYESLDKESQLSTQTAKEAHQLIILSDEDLQKGLIKVEDNLTKENKKIPEDEILDYILSLL